MLLEPLVLLEVSSLFFSRSLATLIWQPKPLSSALLETEKDRQCPTSTYVELEPSQWGKNWGSGQSMATFPSTDDLGHKESTENLLKPFPFCLLCQAGLRVTGYAPSQLGCSHSVSEMFQRDTFPTACLKW